MGEKEVGEELETQVGADCDPSESCADSCEAVPTTCEEFDAMIADDGCASECCDSVFESYEEELCGDSSDSSDIADSESDDEIGNEVAQSEEDDVGIISAIVGGLLKAGIKAG